MRARLALVSVVAGCGPGDDVADPHTAELGVGLPEACLAGGNIAVYEGEPGDKLLEGRVVRTETDYDFRATINGVSTRGTALTAASANIEQFHNTQPNSSSVWFSTIGDGHIPLEPGLYENATRHGDEEGVPWLMVRINTRGCDRLRGAFQLHTIELDSEIESIGDITATFEQSCLETPDATLRGCVHYDREHDSLD